MKIACFGVQPHEGPMMEAWGAANGVDITLTNGPITVDNVPEGVDGVCAQQMSMFERPLLEKMAAAGITVMGIRSAGYNNIPLDVIRELGIRVVRVPAYSPSAIAEYSVARLLQLLRNTDTIDKMVASYNFGLPPLGKELRDLVVGVVGTGNIGERAVEIYRGFGSKVYAFDLYPKDRLRDQVTYVDDPEELFELCDVITLHVPAASVGNDGKRLVDAESIARMKDGSYIVNTARAEHVDQRAVMEAVRSGKLAGAVLDLFDHEVKYLAKNYGDAPEEVYEELRELIAQERILVSGHLAFFTETAARNLVEVSLDGIRDILTTGESANLI